MVLLKKATHCVSVPNIARIISTTRSTLAEAQINYIIWNKFFFFKLFLKHNREKHLSYETAGLILVMYRGGDNRFSFPVSLHNPALFRKAVC